MYTQLHFEYQGAITQPLILSGLGGIGKTQIALEYAYRFRREYQAVLWVGAETQETVLADYRALAELFQLPEQGSTKPSVVKAAVKRWLHSHPEWLLIFDNVEDLELLQSVLPEASQGHILITTRSPVGGKLGAPLAVPMLSEEESALLLLRRAKLLAHDAPLGGAPKIWPKTTGGSTQNQSRWSSRQEWPPAQSHLAGQRMDPS
ncbi:MAG TPA: NB-ARC domain-containing protein [Ktedonobacterales bacterium]